ncbi:hypothetical protein NS220_06260 [Microbacterium testaceum]|uniref:Uncharacterized protein n=1 Tax=Microbacterium testaceum TaxID=2033 RepID=A0A147EYN6_MICTE|nr:hypothetical protein [Microbacterium testaceum]KTR95393.1 hypothetical protein NS220_06260 [Microbacterium testaceum]
MDRELRVTPLNAQVAVFSPSAPDFPEWGTGEEPAVATTTAILVATRDDLAGPVTVRVCTEAAALDGFTTVLGTTLTLRDGVVAFGSFLSGEVERMPLPTTGAFLATVSVDVPGEASSVLVSLTPSS